MQPWLAFLKALIGLAAGYLTYLQSRRLIATGEAMAIAQALNNAQEAINTARLVRDRARDELNAHPERVRDVDEFTRKD